MFGGLSDQEEKPIAQIKAEAEKAFRAGYHKILWPWNFIFHSAAGEIFRLARDDPSRHALQMRGIRLDEFKSRARELAGLSGGRRLPCMADLLYEQSSPAAAAFCGAAFSDFQLTIPARRGINPKELLESLPEALRPRLHIHFPVFHKKHPLLFSSQEMYDFLKERFCPPPPIDVFSLSAPPDLKLEPEIEPEAAHALPSSDILASVVIPSYNSGGELMLCLRHLAAQAMPKENFEVIVTDDGSSDGTSDMLLQADFLRRMNFKLIRFPRERPRRGIFGPLGDHRFRAGIARNLGAKHARGEVLAFLDSDILAPASYLRSVIELLGFKSRPKPGGGALPPGLSESAADVIQSPRLHLKRLAPGDYEKIDPARHTFVKGDGYWERFYSSAADWNQRALPWKYISTNTLSLRTKDFKQAGWFRKNHTCYGFEDTDLGWRLYQGGRRFYLSPLPAYHLPRRSEFLHFQFVKRYLLGQAASIFFHNTHCLEAYEEFRGLIQKRGL